MLKRTLSYESGIVIIIIGLCLALITLYLMFSAFPYTQKYHEALTEHNEGDTVYVYGRIDKYESVDGISYIQLFGLEDIEINENNELELIEMEPRVVFYEEVFDEGDYSRGDGVVIKGVIMEDRDSKFIKGLEIAYHGHANNLDTQYFPLSPYFWLFLLSVPVTFFGFLIFRRGVDKSKNLIFPPATEMKRKTNETVALMLIIIGVIIPVIGLIFLGIGLSIFLWIMKSKSFDSKFEGNKLLHRRFKRGLILAGIGAVFLILFQLMITLLYFTNLATFFTLFLVFFPLGMILFFFFGKVDTRQYWPDVEKQLKIFRLTNKLKWLFWIPAVIIFIVGIFIPAFFYWMIPAMEDDSAYYKYDEALDNSSEGDYVIIRDSLVYYWVDSGKTYLVVESVENVVVFDGDLSSKMPEEGDDLYIRGTMYRDDTGEGENLYVDGESIGTSTVATENYVIFSIILTSYAILCLYVLVSALKLRALERIAEEK